MARRRLGIDAKHTCPESGLRFEDLTSGKLDCLELVISLLSLTAVPLLTLRDAARSEDAILTEGQDKTESGCRQCVRLKLTMILFRPSQPSFEMLRCPEAAAMQISDSMLLAMQAELLARSLCRADAAVLVEWPEQEAELQQKPAPVLRSGLSRKQLLGLRHEVSWH